MPKCSMPECDSTHLTTTFKIIYEAIKEGKRSFQFVLRGPFCAECTILFTAYLVNGGIDEVLKHTEKILSSHGYNLCVPGMVAVTCEDPDYIPDKIDKVGTPEKELVSDSVMVTPRFREMMRKAAEN